LIKIVKNPGNGRLNNLNDPVRNVLKQRWCATVMFELIVRSYQ